MAIYTWLKRVFSFGVEEQANSVVGSSTKRMSAAEILTPQTHADRRASTPSTKRMSAAEILTLAATLQSSNAQWPEIWAALNPDEDAATLHS